MNGNVSVTKDQDSSSAGVVVNELGNEEPMHGGYDVADGLGFI